MTETVQPLGIPPDVEQDGGTEILRVFVSNGGLSVSITRAFDEPDTWGLLMADLVRHVSRIYAAETTLTEDEVEARIVTMLANEMGRPTDLGSTSAMN